jgi:PKD repeat protein
MSTAWGGADPTEFHDAGNSYELGTKFTANATITPTQIRIWHGTNDTPVANRRAHIWSIAGALLATAILPDTLPPGWSTYNLDASVPIGAGQQFWVTYQVTDWYAAILNAYGAGVPSADGQLTAVSGGFNTTLGQAPATATTTFYGADVVYTGNVAPVVGLTATATAPLTASATLAITDETPASVTYKIEWGDGASSSVSTLGPHTHVYASAGTYAVMVTATDSAGLMDSAAVPVTVTAAPGAMRPNAELVAVRWLQGVNGIAAGMVATTLPRDNSTWAASGFVRVDSIVGGEVDAETGYRSAVASITLWAANPSSGRPPWWKAARLGELIAADCEPPARGHRLLTIGTGYRNARVTGVVPRNDPRRLPGDPGSYAKYQMDLSLSWAIV